MTHGQVLFISGLKKLTETKRIRKSAGNPYSMAKTETPSSHKGGQVILAQRTTPQLNTTKHLLWRIEKTLFLAPRDERGGRGQSGNGLRRVADATNLLSVILLVISAGPARITPASRAAHGRRPLQKSQLPCEWCTVQDPRAVYLHTANLDGRCPTEALRLRLPQRRRPFPLTDRLDRRNLAVVFRGGWRGGGRGALHSRRQAAALFSAACRAASACAASRSAAGHRRRCAGDLGGSASSSILQCSSSWR